MGAAPKAVRKGRKKKKSNRDAQVLVMFGFIVAAFFAATSVFLFFCMMPTVVAGVIDRTRKKTKVITVGAMNLAGSIPFLAGFWEKGGALEDAMNTVTDPRTIIVVYCAAGVGYLIDWAMGGIVTTIMLKRAEGRMIEIRKLQADMVERWGQEVTGQIPLDSEGYPLQAPREKDQGRAKKR